MRALLVLCALFCATVAAEEPLDALLRRVVKSDGVDYTGLKSERAVLDRYVKSLEKASPGSTSEEKIAFWINAYNALTLQQVLDEKPAKGDFSVRDDVKEFWKRRTWTVAGRKLPTTCGHPRPSGGRCQCLTRNERGERRELARRHSKAMSNASRLCA